MPNEEGLSYAFLCPSCQTPHQVNVRGDGVLLRSVRYDQKGASMTVILNVASLGRATPGMEPPDRPRS